MGGDLRYGFWAARGSLSELVSCFSLSFALFYCFSTFTLFLFSVKYIFSPFPALLTSPRFAPTQKKFLQFLFI